MISYNPKNWFTFIFRLHKSDTVRKLFPMIAAMALYSWLIAYLELEYWDLSKDHYVKNLTLLHNLLGFVLSMLLVFRTNTAYDRWWEGRKLWGSLVNNSRSLAIKLKSFLPEDKTAHKYFSRIIPLYASVLSNHLQSEKTRLALDEHEHPELKHLNDGKHQPNHVSMLIVRHINQLYKEQKITGEQLIILNNEMQTFTDVCGACERIKNTPIPYSYSVFLKKFIFFYIMSLPFGFVFSLGYYVIPVVSFIFYVLASLELIAEEIEDPFGKDANDLPTEKIAANIKTNVAEIFAD
ncbi:MAG: bestrophin family ion channel [Chitinophagaceae bacterium]